MNMKKDKSRERAALIDRGIRLTFLSLETHLHWTHQKDKDGFKWHKDAVADYAAVIKILADLY